MRGDCRWAPLHDAAMDDLRRLAKGDEPGHEGACAYHSATALAKRSHIIFCPYQYLMNPTIRQARGIEHYLERAIAIWLQFRIYTCSTR